MDLGQLKKQVQDHLTDGLVTIVGSGVSAACGLPTMGALAEKLLERLPERIEGDLANEWRTVALALEAGQGLEDVLTNVSAESELNGHVATVVAEIISEAEAVVVNAVLAGETTLPFSDLLPYIIFHTDRLPIITSNYDRLIEFSAELNQIGVDTCFVGQHYGIFDQQKSKESLGYATRTRTRTDIKRVYRQHIALFKPHGSLDWYEHDGNPIRSSFPIAAPRLMITPGHRKYRQGYESPFDIHRAEANKAIDKAARFLVLGYGFNDDQLETHLRTEIGKGKPCIIVTRSLTQNAQQLVTQTDSILAIVKDDSTSESGTLILTSDSVNKIAGVDLWSLEGLVQEVL